MGTNTASFAIPKVHEALLDGRRLRYVDVGEGSCILLVHGFAGSWQIWLENIGPLAETHRVVAVDLPGFGRSQALPPSAPLQAYGDRLAALLEWLEVPSATAVGHSMGGLVCQRFAADHPDQADGLILVSSGGLPIRSSIGWLVKAAVLANGVALRRQRPLRLLTSNRRVRSILLSRALVDPGCVSDELLREVLPGLGAPGMVNAVGAGLREDITTSLDRISCPTLLLWGDRDRLLPPRNARRLADRIEGAQLEVWEGVGHGPMLERVDAFNDRVRRFAATEVATERAARQRRHRTAPRHKA